MNTRRVRRALAKLFEGHVGKDVVSRAWQKTRAAWEAWQERDLAGDDIVRLILDGTMVKVRLDRKATAISLLIALGIRRDGQKVVLAIRNMGGESEAAWRAVLDDLTSRGLARPDLVIVDGGKGLEAALASLWDDVPVQRCAVHKERNLLAHAPKHLHDEIKAEFNDMMHAKTAAEVLARRKAFLARWKLRCRAVAESLEEAGERLFTFLRYPPDRQAFCFSGCYDFGARATAWRRARPRLRASPGCLIRMNRRSCGARAPASGLAAGVMRSSCCASAARRAPFNQAGEARRAARPPGWWRGAPWSAWVAIGPRSADRRARPVRRSPSPGCVEP